MLRPRVLVVDENTSTCLFIATTLQQAGYEVSITHSGQEALSRIMQFHPQCLILNVILPDISGYAICRYVRQNIPEHRVSIILISTKRRVLDKNYGLRQGADRYLSQPFSAETLQQMVWEVIPEPLRNTVRTVSAPVSQQHRLPEFTELIPRRVANQEAMRTSSPFAHTAIIADAHASQLYAAIDGRKTIAEIATVTELEIKEILRALDMLLKENSIQIYNLTGQLVENTQLLSAR